MLSNIAGLRHALSLLDEYSTERDPAEVLIEFRLRLVHELDDCLPTLKDVQDWVTRILYQNHGKFNAEMFTERALNDINMTVFFAGVNETNTGAGLVLLCKRRRIHVEMTTGVPPRGGMSPYFHIDKIDVRKNHGKS